MFMVLGVVIVVTMLGFLGMMMSERDNASAGSSLGLKSQRMAATSGLHLAVARMQAQPTVTVAALNAFILDNTRTNIVFSTSGATGFTLEAAPAWFLLGGAGQEAVQVQILGVGRTGADGGLPIYLSSQGRGRDGQVFEVRGVYKIRGLDFQISYPTKGPTEGLLALSGLTDVNAGTTIDGGIYSGKLGTLTRIQSNGTANFGRIRVAGNLEFHASSTSPLAVTGNSLVGGTITLMGTGVARFQKHLVVGYAAGAGAGYGQAASYGGFGTTFSPTLQVDSSLYVFGTSSPQINANIVVGQDFWMRDAELSLGGHLTVGYPTNPTSRVWLDKGITTSQTSGSEIHGRLSVGPRGTGDQQFYGWIHVGGDLEVYSPGLVPRMEIMGATHVAGNLSTSTSVVCLTNPPGGTIPASLTSLWSSGSEAPCLQVDGSSWLGNGIKEISRSGSIPGAGIVLKGPAYLDRGIQEGFSHAVRLENSLTMSGGVDWTTFGAAGKAAWFFPTTATPKTWSYRGVAGYEGRLTNGAGTARGTDSMPAATAVVPTRPVPRTIAQLGFLPEERSLALADNPASTVRTAKLGTYADYEAIHSTYATTCGLSGSPPTGTQLKCIYDAEIASAGSYLWDSKYLIIRIQSDPGRFGNLTSLSAPNRVIPSGVKVFWIVEGTINVNSSWYAGQEGSIQIVYSSPSGSLNNFGWAGGFYGFIQLTGGYSQIGPPSGSTFDLYGAIEIAPTNASSPAISMNSGANFNIYRNSPITQEVFSDIAGSFFSSDGVGSTPDSWVIRFNGDRADTDIAALPTLELRDGWIQLERVGEYR